MVRDLNRFYLLYIGVVIIGFVLLVPKVNSRILSKQRSRLYESFMADIRRNNTVDPVPFWKFREFYSPGAFEFHKDGVDIVEKKSIIDQFELTNRDDMFLFLRYKSDRVQSVEGLLDSPVLPIATGEAWMNKDNCILNNMTEKYCKRNGNIMVLYFVKPLEEMKKANAFYDYRDEAVAARVKGKYWFVAMIVRLD